jgi:tetratricopeptide (TPR) repeat protein
LNEEDAVAQFEYGNMLIGQGRFEEALPHLLIANELQPNRGPILAAIGYTQFNFGRLEGSKVSLLAAVRTAPRFALAWYHLGNTQMALGDVEGAIESYQMALSLRPDFTLAQEALKTATASDTLSQP